MSNSKSTSAETQNAWELISAEDGPIQDLNELEGLIATAKLALNSSTETGSDITETEAITHTLAIATKKVGGIFTKLQLILDTNLKQSAA